MFITSPPPEVQASSSDFFLELRRRPAHFPPDIPPVLACCRTEVGLTSTLVPPIRIVSRFSPSEALVLVVLVLVGTTPLCGCGLVGWLAPATGLSDRGPSEGTVAWQCALLFFLSGGQYSSVISSGHRCGRSRATRIGSSCGRSTLLILAVLTSSSRMRNGPWYGHANLRTSPVFSAGLYKNTLSPTLKFGSLHFRS